MSSRWTTAVRSSGLWRFLSVGVGDAVTRLARVTACEAPDEADVVRAVETSSVVAAIERVLDAVSAAARTSVVVRLATARSKAWLGQPLVRRARGAGVALLTAVAVHLALAFWQGPMAGWLWLVIPALAAAFGALLALAPSRGLPDRAPR
jgi:hypothetical protein